MGCFWKNLLTINKQGASEEIIWEPLSMSFPGTKGMESAQNCLFIVHFSASYNLIQGSSFPMSSEFVAEYFQGLFWHNSYSKCTGELGRSKFLLISAAIIFTSLFLSVKVNSVILFNSSLIVKLQKFPNTYVKFRNIRFYSSLPHPTLPLSPSLPSTEMNFTSIQLPITQQETDLPITAWPQY